MINLNINKICFSGGDIIWHQSSWKECLGSLLPTFFSQWEIEAYEGRRLTGKKFPLKIEYCPSNDQFIAKFDELCYNYRNICTKPIYPHLNFQFICINSSLFWDLKWRQGQPCGNRRLSLAWKHGTTRASSRLGPAGSKEELAWNGGGTSPKQRWG